MYIDFLLKRKKALQVEQLDPAVVTTDRRRSRLERRRRTERRKGNLQNYTGESRRVTIDRREKLAERRDITVEINSEDVA